MDKKLAKAIKRMRKKSGSIDDNRLLVDFIYIIGRDYIPLGKIESIMLMIDKGKKTKSEFSNGWLAEYAQDVAERLSK